MTFKGYARPSGPAGIRNIVLVIAGDLCCNPWAEEIAAPFENCFALLHKHGVGNYAPDRALFKRLIGGVTVNPNVAGFVFVSSGNEDHPPGEILARAREAGRKYSVVSIRELRSGATLVRKGKMLASRLVREALDARRVPAGFDQLRIGLNCAGTDTASATSSNLVTGLLSDRIVAADGTVVFSETPDYIGLGEKLFGRCETASGAEKLRRVYEERKRLLAATGEKIDDIEMVGFNTEGGLKTLGQKAAVSILKAGTAGIAEVVNYGVTSSKTGLVFMDGPAITDFVMTGLMSAGAHLMVSTVGAGEGNRMPFLVGADFPSPILPVIKVTGSTEAYNQKVNKIDFNAAVVRDGAKSAEQAADDLFGKLAAIVNGRAARTESRRDYYLNIPVRYHQA